MASPPRHRPRPKARVQQLREQLQTLAAGCPHTRTNPSSCPLHEVRKLEPEAVLRWLDGLTTPEKDFLIMYHQCCLVINQEADAAKRSKSK